ncbi:tetratricopeptide repeat protein, partial [bacterium]|nr:tetratricopeptide repeat protein [bacterium]
MNKMKHTGGHIKKVVLLHISHVRRYAWVLLFTIFLFAAGLVNPGVCQAAARVVPGEINNTETRKRIIDTAGERKRVDIETGRAKVKRLVIDGKYKEALGILERLYQKHPDSDVTAKLLADVYIRVGRAEEAIVFLEKKLKVKARNFEFVKILGRAYLEMGEKEKAEKVWRRMLVGDKSKVPYYDNVAVLLWDAGQYANAISVLREGAVGGYYRSRMRKIVNWERILGKTNDAFQDELNRLSSEERKRDLRSADTILEIFVESGKDSALLSLFDAVADRQEKENEFMNLVKALLFVEADRYKKAWELLSGKDGDLPDENLYYSFIYSVAQMNQKMGGEDYENFLLQSTRRFLEEYDKSRMAPKAILLEAKLKFIQAVRVWPYSQKRLEEAFRAAEGVMGHWAASPYYDNARLLMAEIQLEGMGSPEKALDILDRSKWRRKSIEKRAKIMRAEALSISDRREEAEKELKALVLDSDSTIVPEVEFRLSELHFYSGKYSMALAGFSKLAEEYSSNNTANDALELAMFIKKEIDREKGALDLFASARFFDNRGKLINAIDSLGMFEERFSESPLLPRVLLWRSSLEIEVGMNNIAKADLERLAERYPMSVY